MAVYVVEACGFGCIKIGYCEGADVRRRFSGLQIGCPVRLRPRLILRRRGYAYEQWLHARFRSHHVRGEWFRLLGDVAEWLSMMTTAPLISDAVVP